MSTLTGNKISLTYKSLFKTADNDVLTATLKQMSDGLGNNSGVYLNTGGDLKTTGILEFANFKGTSTAVTINKLVNEADGISNNDNDTSLPTSAAVKDYVDTHVTTQDLDFKGDSGTGAVDLDSQLLDIAGTTNEIVTSASAQKLTIGLPNSVTISGTYTGATFSGDLNGTINTATTATTQSAGDNSTKVATTAYVDTLDAASDLDFSGTTGTGDVNLNTQTFAVSGTANQITTAASNQGLQISLLSTGVTMPNGSVATTQSAGDNSTKLATTAYVDVLDSASDLDITDGTNTSDVNLNTQSLSILGTANEIVSIVSAQTATISLPSTINVNVTGNVTGNLTGNADTATKWQTARNLSLSGEATGTIASVDGSVAVSGAVTLTNSAVVGKVLTGLPTPAAGNIVATDTILNAFGKLQSQISTISSGLVFKGSWDADTNTPALVSGGGEVDSGTTTSQATNRLIQTGQNFNTTVSVGNKVINQTDGTTALVTVIASNTELVLDADIMLNNEAYTIDASPFIPQGNYYVVNFAGTTNLNGITDWAIGDWVIADADNRWSKLDHSQIDGGGSLNSLPVFTSSNTIGDSIVAQAGTALTITGSATTTLGLSSTGDFAVNTNKFTANATTGNVAFSGDLAINTNKFTVNATSGNTVVGGTLNSGAITSTGNIEIRSGNKLLLQRPNNGVATEISTDSTGAMILNSVNIEGFFFNNNGTNAFKLDPINATFAGDVLLSGYLSVEGTTGNTGGASDRWIGGDGTAGTWFYNVPTGSSHLFGINNSNILTLNGAGATFTGNVTVPNGLISTIGGNNLTISGSVADHAGISFATNTIIPIVQSAETNNIVDIGQNGNAFKNLYLGSEIISGGGATFAGNVTVNNSGDGKITVGGTAGLEIIHNNAGNTIAEIKQLYASTSNSAQMKLTGGFTTFHTGTSGTERMRIDSTGNFGLNAEAENSSGTWRNLQFGSLSMAGRANDTNPDGMIGTNFKFTTANAEQRISADPASRIFFNDNVTSFQNAGTGAADSAITWANNLVIDSSGNSTFAGIITANSSSSGDYVRMYGSSGTGKWDIYGNGANLRISDNESAGILAVDTGATFGGNVKINTTVSTLGKLSVKSDSGANTFYNNIQCVPSDSNTGGLFIGSNVANDAIMVTGAYYANAGNYTPTSTSASIINMFSGNIVFRADDSLTVGTNYVPTERMRIQSDGDINITGGGRILSSAGIYLGTNNNVNLLNSYEEGPWTPEIYYQDLTDRGNATNTTQTGIYTKVGRNVTVMFRLIWEITGSPATDNCGIQNLPFNGQALSNNLTYAEVPCILKGYSNPSTGGRGSLTLSLPNNNSDIAMFNDSNIIGNMGGVIGAGTHEIRFSFTYTTDQ